MLTGRNFSNLTILIYSVGGEKANNFGSSPRTHQRFVAGE